MSSVSLSDIVGRGRNNFDFLRLIAAAAVIVSHAFVMTQGSRGIEPLEQVSAFTLGQHAVNMFFMLSGLLVASSLDRSSSLVAFARARVLRIFPALTVCVCVTAFVIGPFASDLSVADYVRSTQPYAYIIKTLTLSTGAATLPGVFDTLHLAGAVNVPLWTLKYEVLSYLLLGLLAATGIWQRGWALASFIAALLAWNLIFMPEHDLAKHGVVDHMARFFTCFFLGVAAFRARARLRLSSSGAAVAVMAIVLSDGSSVEQFVNVIAVAYLVLCAAALPLPRLRALCARGDMSYGLYIYGWPLAQIVLLLAPGIGPVELALATLALAGMAATASWLMVERPAMALGHRLATTGWSWNSAPGTFSPGRSAVEKRPLDSVQT